MTNTKNSPTAVEAETQDLRAAYVAPTVRVLFVKGTELNSGTSGDGIGASSTSGG